MNQSPSLWVLLQLLTIQPGGQTFEYGKTDEPVGDTEDLGRDMACSEKYDDMRAAQGVPSLYLSTELSVLPLWAF